MKFPCRVLYVLAVISFVICSVFSDEDVDFLVDQTSAGGGRHRCDVQLKEHQTSNDIPQLLLDRVVNCYLEERKFITIGLDTANTSEDYRDVFKNSCAKLPVVNACMDEVASKLHRCLNETLTASINVFKRDFQLVMDVGCVDEGARTAGIVEEIVKLKKNSFEFDAIFHNCSRESIAHLHALDMENSTKVSVAYFDTIRYLNRCVARQEQNALMGLILSFLGEIINRLQCIHPVSHSELPCETFVNT